MALWKKSEDPWDIDPEKRRGAPTVYEQETEQEKAGLLDELKSWNEARKEKKEAEASRPAEKCPWCGGEMVQGYLYGDRGVWWAPGKPDWKTALIGPSGEAARLDLDGGIFTSHRDCWFCEACRRLIADVPEQPGPNYIYENGKVVLPEETEKQE